MRNETLDYTAELVIVVCWCGTHHAVPSSLRHEQERQHRDGRQQLGIYCPLGHTHIIAGEGKAARLQLRLDEREAQLTALRDQLAAAEREAKRQAKRSAGGVCPCCNRSFVQLARHMKSQHPEHAT